MHYEPLKNDKKTCIDMSNVTFQYPTNPQLIELNRTRKILTILTTFELFITILCMIIITHAYVFGYTLGIESYNPIVRFLPFISGICFLIGLIIVERCHASGLRIYSKLLMLNLIFTYLILTIFILIPICMKGYKINPVTTIIFALMYQTIFSIIGILPGITIRYAEKLSTLLAENTCLLIQ